MDIYHPSPERYDHTIYRRCGRSGLMLPPISLGLWHNFGDEADSESTRNMILHAFDRGITYFDLADNYGPPPGSAEERFGRILKQDLKPYRDECIIATKAGHLMWPGPYGDWGSRKHLLAGLDQSLARLQMDYVDIFYAHRYDPNTPLEETAGALVSAIRSGKALYAGISKFPVEATRKICRILREERVPCLIHQLRYNLLNREPVGEIFRAIGETETGCAVFSPLAQGLLSNRYLNGIPADSRAAGTSPFLTKDRVDEYQEYICFLADLAEQRGQSVAQLALSWVLSHPQVTTAIIGASRVSQIDDCLKACSHLHFTEEEQALLRR